MNKKINFQWKHARISQSRNWIFYCPPIWFPNKTVPNIASKVISFRFYSIRYQKISWKMINSFINFYFCFGGITAWRFINTKKNQDELKVNNEQEVYWSCEKRWIQGRKHFGRTWIWCQGLIINHLLSTIHCGQVKGSRNDRFDIIWSLCVYDL